MTINGRFGLVSATDYRDGVVLVGFLGNVYPHDLKQEQIDYIKGVFNMPGCYHQIFSEWPEYIAPLYPAAKKNFRNGFMLLTTESPSAARSTEQNRTK